MVIIKVRAKMYSRTIVKGRLKWLGSILWMRYARLLKILLLGHIALNGF
jgi:hypothetical protein